MKNFWKSVNICRRYGQLSTGLFFYETRCNIPYTRCGRNKYSLKLSAVFSATAWNLCVKFYMFTWLFYLHSSEWPRNAKRHLIIFKYDKVIEAPTMLVKESSHKRVVRRSWLKTIGDRAFRIAALRRLSLSLSLSLSVLTAIFQVNLG